MFDSATRLKRLVRSYIHHSPEYIVGKLVPRDAAAVTGGVQAYTVAHSAQELLEYLPYFVDNVTSDVAGRHVMLCLRRTLLHYLRRHARRMGGALARDVDHRGDFVVWVVLSVYADMAAETEARWRCEGSGNEAAVYSRGTRRRLQSLYAYCDERLRQHQGSPWELLEQADYLAGASEAMWGRGECELMPYHANRHVIEHFMRDHVVPVIIHSSQRHTATFQRTVTVVDEEDANICGANGGAKQPCLTLDACVTQARHDFRYDAFSPGFSALHVAAATIHATGELLCAARKDLAARDTRACRASHRCGPSTQPEREDGVRAERARLAHVLAVATQAIQLVPTLHEPREAMSESSDDEVGSAGSRSASVSDKDSAASDGDTTGGGGPCYGGVYGSWLTTSDGSVALTQQGARYRPLHTRRLSLLLPGLLFAATECSAAIDVPARATWAALWTPDAMVAAGTCLIAPSSARPTLLLGEDELRHCVIDPLCMTALYVTPSHLRPVALLLLFSTFPCYERDEETGAGVADCCCDGGLMSHVAGWRALAWAVRRVQTGLVVLVCEGQVETRERRAVEGWGTASRSVVLLQCVGTAGLTQLALQHDCVPNRACTSLPQLRAPPAGTAGLLLYALDELVLRRRRSASPGRGDGEGHGDLNQSALYERRVRLVAAIGRRVNEYHDRDSPRPYTPHHVIAESHTETAGTQSMYGARDESSSSSSSGSSDEDSESTSASSASRLLLLPRTLFGVVVGGVSAALQKEWLHTFRVVHHRLLQLLLLPALTRETWMSYSVPVTAEGGMPYAEVSVIAQLDQLRTSPTLAERATTTAACHDKQDAICAYASTNAATATDDFLHRVQQSLREAVWTYELLSLQQEESNCSAEQAWQKLTRATQSVTRGEVCEGVTIHATCRSYESVLDVTEAYLSIGRCLDTLFCTPLYFTQTASPQATHQSTGTLVLLPLIE